jgi:twinkle protein
MSVIRGKSPEELGIEIPEHKRNANRDFKVAYCPGCEAVGKKNFRDSSLSVNLVKKVANCHKCGTRYKWGKASKVEVKEDEYVLPSKKGIHIPSGGVIEYVKSRGISEQTIKACMVGVKEFKDRKTKKTKEFVVFPYMQCGEFVNAKYRGVEDKEFRQEANAKPILWNYDLCDGAGTIILTEGEFDAMAIMESLGPERAIFSVNDPDKANKIGVTSINNGAINENDKDIEGKLKGFRFCYDLFENADKVILATDEDVQGRRLRDELAARMPEGIEVAVMKFGEQKDANEMLKKEGASKLVEAIDNNKLWFPKSIQNLEDFEQEFFDMVVNGQIKGTTTYYDAVDQIWKWRKKEVTIITGYANEGKSTVYLQLAMAKAKHDGDKFLVYTPENMPQAEFIDDLVQCYVGKTLDSESSNQATEQEIREAFDFVKKHFFLISPEEGVATTEDIIAAATAAKRSHGIDHLVIDPYNMVVHDFKIGDREDLYVSKFMTKLKMMAIKLSISVALIAHQVTPEYPDKKTRNFRPPSMYKIKGGGTFADKADNVLTFWRPFFTHATFMEEFVAETDERLCRFIQNAMMSERQKVFHLRTIGILKSEKIKKQKLVAQRGSCIMKFDVDTGRYSAIEFDGNDIHGQNPFGGTIKPKDVFAEGPKAEPEVIEDKYEELPPNEDEDEDDCPF